MKEDTINRLDQEFVEFPVMRSDDVPSDEEIDAASQKIGIQFPEDYRQFLQRYGSAMVGAYPIFGLRPVAVLGKRRWSVLEMTNQFRSSSSDEFSDWIVFSEDHAGSPIGMDTKGKVWINDHDFGGVTELADSFEEYIRIQCLKLTK